ncbi:bifunctional phosphoribosyl-AMP cyclohydrolase/phosphoribosyl-ATP diphosphatase HisIE [Solilutibacter tolerans]|uniref:Histidine biosynthesis bifunctional protein HisIE n=1 Tax=Solilutibacter tolerans TaxID=1604334 RepID=A0A1N6X752_9GAMM|nr:bifunctional phosphoribosyl-AMP cyclohydrolase/phosphoribosyl-ATP diphosphatase HisIE [Lysobacter tolerans]SIQ98097.1 phosphoribosyl-ATP pyrophosphatase /phosphoribosyl-AMP cyclohydrolase [Lysobacter tolerans]
MIDIDRLDWRKQGGLIPAIVQDATTLQVLMMGWMSRESLAITLHDGRVTFYSRTRNRLWTKGETSGNTLQLVNIEVDCDADTLLVQANPNGPTCHLGRASCFPAAPANVLAELDGVITARERDRPDGSYTTRLFQSGVRGIAQKVGEEGVEVALAAVAQDDKSVLDESADLLFHLLVLLRSRGMSIQDVLSVLADRRG